MCVLLHHFAVHLKLTQHFNYASILKNDVIYRSALYQKQNQKRKTTIVPLKITTTNSLEYFLF